MHRTGPPAAFMIKAEMQQVKVVNSLIKHTDTIPVDRGAGAEPMRWPCSGCARGNWSACYPEATISRSFELREFKTGAARMALRGAGADRPDDCLGSAADLAQGPSKEGVPQQDSDHRGGGRAAGAAEDIAEQLNVALRDAMTALLYKVQEEYPHPEGGYWVPRRLGGSAPTPGRLQGRCGRPNARAGHASTSTTGVTRPGRTRVDFTDRDV